VFALSRVGGTKTTRREGKGGDRTKKFEKHWYGRSIPDFLLFLNYFLSVGQWAPFS